MIMEENMRIVGYYNSYARQEVLDELDVKALTHINYAFLLPKENGTVYFKDKDDVKRVVDFAHSHGLKINVSVGGWCDGNIVLDKVFKKIFSSKESIMNFIESILEIVHRYSFDGVDIDWEYPDSLHAFYLLVFLTVLKRNLEAFGSELSLTIHHAVKGDDNFNRVEGITASIVEAVDYLNIMTYDCHNMSNHSSLYLAKKCIKYWCVDRKVPKEKVLIGIPFYSRPSEMYYCEIVKESPISAYLNFYKKESYNGIELVAEKIKFAKQYCGGVIIWAINYDTTDDYSLLTTIKKSLKNE